MLLNGTEAFLFHRTNCHYWFHFLSEFHGICNIKKNQPDSLYMSSWKLQEELSNFIKSVYCWKFALYTGVGVSCKFSLNFRSWRVKYQMSWSFELDEWIHSVCCGRYNVLKVCGRHTHTLVINERCWCLIASFWQLMVIFLMKHIWGHLGLDIVLSRENKQLSINKLLDILWQS